MPRVLTLGTFDLPHAGHVSFFRECRKLATPSGALVVGVNSDEFVAKFKSRPPVVDWEDRATVISSIRYVSDVIKNDGDDQAALIEHHNPDFLAIGVDWACKDYYAQLGITQEWLYDRNISLVYVAHERSMTISTSQIKKLIAEMSEIPPAPAIKRGGVTWPTTNDGPDSAI